MFNVLYLSFWIVHSLTFYLFSLLYPGNITLGTHRLTVGEGMVYAGFWMTFLYWIMWDFAGARKMKLSSYFSAFMFMWFINSFSVWMVGRFAFYTAFGISNYWWAIIIGFFILIFQLFVWSSNAKK